MRFSLATIFTSMTLCAACVGVFVYLNMIHSLNLELATVTEKNEKLSAQNNKLEKDLSDERWGNRRIQNFLVKLFATKDLACAQQNPLTTDGWYNVASAENILAEIDLLEFSIPKCVASSPDSERQRLKAVQLLSNLYDRRVTSNEYRLGLRKRTLLSFSGYSQYDTPSMINVYVIVDLATHEPVDSVVGYSQGPSGIWFGNNAGSIVLNDENGVRKSYTLDEDGFHETK